MLKQNRIFFLIILSLVLITADYLGNLNFIKSPIDGILIPVKQNIFAFRQVFYNLGMAASSYSQISNITREKTDLTRKNEELQLKLGKLAEENLKLRALLDAPFPASYKFMPARVIAKSRYMEIDAGEESGIRKGQIVIYGESLVGKIVQVFPKRSNILLISDPDFKIKAVTSRNVRGEVIGQNQGVISLAKVLQKDPLFLSDLVETSGEEFVPAGLLIGKIIYINQQDTASYKNAAIQSPIDFDNIKMVFVVTSL